MYFPNAFRKDFVGKVDAGALVVKTAGKTQELVAGEIGLFDAKTYSAIAAAPASGNQPFILAQGSLHTTDKIGPFHGGYKESVKSKLINPKYVSRFFQVAARAAQTQKLAVGADTTDVTAPAGAKFAANTTYLFRLDIKGSQVQRFMNRNIYHTFDVYTGCDDAATPVVDAVSVYVALKKQIENEPYIAPFVKATVKKFDGAAWAVVDADAYVPVVGATADDVVGAIEIEFASVDTKYGDATFTVTDHYELVPLEGYISLVDESGEPCATGVKINSSTGENVTELQVAKQASGSGETILRNLILSNRYLQEPFSDGSSINSLRLREILDDVNVKQVGRTAFYDQIGIVHNVPRLMNSSSTFDNDQYLLVINVPTGTDTSVFVDLFQAILDNAGNGVELETL